MSSRKRKASQKDADVFKQIGWVAFLLKMYFLHFKAKNAITKIMVG